MFHRFTNFTRLTTFTPQSRVGEISEISEISEIGEISEIYKIYLHKTTFPTQLVVFQLIFKNYWTVAPKFFLSTTQTVEFGTVILKNVQKIVRYLSNCMWEIFGGLGNFESWTWTVSQIKRYAAYLPRRTPCP